MKRALVVAILALLSGCVDRELRVRPEPEDALVFVDGAEIAVVGSVATCRYEHYGMHRVVVRKLSGKGKKGEPSYEAKEQLVTLDPPWYQIFPIDFFFDILWPGTIEDHREIEVALEPRQDLSDKAGAGKQVIERARVVEEEAKGP